MKLKYQLLLLALLSLLFPITGWFALKSVDQEFRSSIEQAAKNTLLSLKASIQQIKQDSKDLQFHGLTPHQIKVFQLDGDNIEWQNIKPYVYNNNSDRLTIKISHINNKLTLLIDSNDTSPNINSANSNNNDHIIIALADNRGVYKLRIKRQAEGEIQNNANFQEKPKYKAYWHEKAKGYLIEIQFENNDFHHLGIASINKIAQKKLITGTLDSANNLKLLPIISRDKAFTKIVNNITPDNNHFILKDLQNRIIYQSNKLPNNQSISAFQWIITPIYQWLFGIDNHEEGNKWFYRQADGMAGIKHTIIEDGITYELKSMMPQGQQSMIQTLLKASIFMIAIVLLLMLAYLSYAMMLAWRIKNLNNAMRTVMDDSGQLHTQMPAHNASDEIGQLSRGIESMLSEMREYTQYLKDLGSRLSHEMKTPLAIVQSSLDNLEMEQSPEFLERAQLGTKRLKFILNQLSELSQLKYTLEQTPKQVFDLTELIRQLSQSYKSFIPNLKTYFSSNKLMINGSPELLAQLVDKLMDNAKDFISDDGYIIVSVLKYKDKAQLKIFNTDSQLPNKDLNIFDSLVSIRAKTKINTTHLGLGLYLVQLISRYHDATVNAENTQEPKGVVFTIEFNQLEL